MSASIPNQTLRAMPREMRMMSERILSMTGLPKGVFLVVPDLVMYSQRLGLGGFALLETRFDAFCEARPEAVSIVSEKDGSLHLGGSGQHAWLVLPAVIDLLGELADRFGQAEVSVSDVVDAAELKVAEAFGCRSGLSVTVATEGAEVVLRATRRPLCGDERSDDPLLWDLLENGIGVDAELWWRTYYMAKKALAPDSVVSRRHAGPMIVTNDGTVIGRKDNDDETDISFLTAPRPTETRTESTNS